MMKAQGVDYELGDVDQTGERPGLWMQTFTGRRFFPLDLRAEDLDIEDIGHALGLLCRYNGHTSRFYSVAEHSVLMVEHAFAHGVGRSTLRTILMHDAAEAYVGDCAYAVKQVIPGFKELEAKVEKVLAEKFYLDQSFDTKKAVKELDRRIVLNERRALLKSKHEWVADAYEPLNVVIRCWAPSVATHYFLDLYDQVKPNRGTNDG